MKSHKAEKKSALAVGTTLLSTGIALLVKAQMYKGGALLGLGIGLILVYDYLDDKVKGEPKLPAGIDQETFEQIGDLVQEHGPELKELLEAQIESAQSSG